MDNQELTKNWHGLQMQRLSVVTPAGPLSEHNSAFDIRSNSTTGYKNVTFSRSSKKFKAEANAGGKGVHLGYFDTVEEAATAYARSEYGRADAAKLLQPRPAPTPAGAEAIRQAEREGLTLTASSSSNTGYKGVCCRPTWFVDLPHLTLTGHHKGPRCPFDIRLFLSWR
ncbi:hypothetical protein EMIHUDRAFT_248298 [Emiliania huxleyi CCMP1516]|uniref:AP2/ERF domain-containing protein n=2 Tax=Emiliania huxleyi TaxID=2903 RepID=A0A0D3IH42_EMIH1|nr:hypothetical protein EMIHUDRAFT_248298 [Emiliania huxleyi CCMP1516]EOD10577.1 hypothetical protein EMIHUDRAFT_248298 [Emiliania huxleyi CCMP1516]|eukprot:XP_005763006.1 hypothetical protein EMIHUDRAFT_248298 [Emiliania huxleyi CCMP1516]